MNDLFNIEGKRAVVSGADGHLMSVLCNALIDGGAEVVPFDLTNGLDVTVKAHWEKIGTADILINGAGLNAATPFFEIMEKEWNDILAVQLTGTMLGCQVIGAKMVEQGSGSIINISSASSGPPLSKAFAYSVAKAGVKNLTQNLAREWACAGVRVNALRPGFFPSPFMQEHFLTDERVSAILGHTPMARFGEPSELIGAVLWLASNASSFVTGSEIPVDGGFTCQTI